MIPPSLFTYAPRILSNGRTVVDELCTCGFLHTQHHPLTYESEGRCITVPGKGHLGKCLRFTWKAFVLADQEPHLKTKKEPDPCRTGAPNRQKTRRRTRTGSSARRRKARSPRSPSAPK